MKEVLLVSHNGLGDNLFMVGALRFLLNFYETVYFLCKMKYFKSVHSIFFNEEGIKVIPFNEKKEFREVRNHINRCLREKNKDILTCGSFYNIFKPLIRNKKFLNFTPEPEKYTIEYDQITSTNYSFIKNFYKNININLNHFYDYFQLPETEKSLELYESVKDYYLIFIQSTCSDGRKLNLKNVMKKYLKEENCLLVCVNENLYQKENKNYQIAENFLFHKGLKILDYLTILKNSREIYIIDSAFTGVILPYVKTKKLRADITRIILRQNHLNTIL